MAGSIADATLNDLDADRRNSFLDDAVDPATVISPEDPQPVGEQTGGANTDPKPVPKSTTEPKVVEDGKDGKARDEKGRFAPKTGDQGAKPIRGGTTKPDPVAEPVATTAAPEPAAAPVPVDAPADALPPPEPFVFPAYGEQVTIPGAQYIKGHGAFIPEAALADVRQAWARNLRHDHVVGLADTARKEAAEARTSSAIEKAQWELLANQVSPEWLASLGVDPTVAEREIKRLELDVREARIRIQSQAPVAQAQTPQVTDGDLAQAFEVQLDQFAGRPEFKDAWADPVMGPEIRDELRTQRKLFEVPWDALPKGEQQALLERGFPVGVPVLDRLKLQERIQTLTQRFGKFARASSASAGAAQVARRNAPAPSASPAPPPAVATPSAATPASNGSRTRVPSHFAGTTWKERHAAVRKFWDDPEAE